MKKRLWLKIMIGVVIAAVISVNIAPLWGLVLGGPSIGDRFTAMNFAPSEKISDLVKKSGMNDNGRFWFFVAQPQINEREEFNINCADVMHQETVVLGCYNGQIFLFNVTDERIRGIKAVTAAHEMLHVVYERLGVIERGRVDNLLRQELANTTDESILELVELYDETEPGQKYNELHSIFGTQKRELSPELEKYYGKFFGDRQKVVTANEKYEEIFNEISRQADEMEAKLGTLGSEIESRKSSYEFRANQLASDINWFNSCADTIGCFASEYSFNIQRAGLVAEQNALSVESDAINMLIEEYNQIINDLQALGREAEKLQINLDSQSLL